MVGRAISNFFAVFVVTIVLAIILPLNQIWDGVLIDFLLMVNISLSMVILLLTMYVKEALDFSSFPSILLVTTLFRLALNVSTTRGILSSGYAGHVVATFGEFVMSGDPIVGFIVFVIIVLVNMMVITKGSGRVSEVAARFTLDAMPGKQMAIDADLNAGNIDETQAITRRAKIQQEADFFGAMDGATKFVAGDAKIAIVITFINLIGGAIIGMVRGGMTFNEVMMMYSLATVGEGLASQIPSLLISVATGMVVTRTSSRSDDFNQEIKKQFTQSPTSLIITGVAVIFMMAMPGFPKPVLFVIGAFLIFLGIYLIRQKRLTPELAGGVGTVIDRAEGADGGSGGGTPGAEGGVVSDGDYYRNIDNVYKLLGTEQIEMEFGYSLLHLVDEKSGGNTIERVVLFRKQFALEMGMVFPSVRMRNNPEINPNQYLIKIKGEEVARGEILVDHYLAIDNGDVTTPVDGIDTIEPAFNIPARWISEDKKIMADVAGYTLIDPVSVMITHLSEIIKAHCHEILTRQDVKTMVENINKTNPTVVEDLVPNVVSYAYLQKILSMLLREGVPVRDMETILETLGDNISSLKDPDIACEYVRQSLKRTITRRFADSNSLRVFSLDSGIEDLITANIKRTEKGGQLVLDPVRVQMIGSAVAEMCGRYREVVPNLIVLCSPVVRAYFKKLAEQYAADLIALSYNEIEPTVQIQSIGVIKI